MLKVKWKKVPEEIDGRDASNVDAGGSSPLHYAAFVGDAKAIQVRTMSDCAMNSGVQL